MGTNGFGHIDLFAGHSGVTGSSFWQRAKVNGRAVSFLVDFGMFQETEYEDRNAKLFFDPKMLDFVCVTHAHTDHAGRLPLLAKEGYDKEIYCTNDTAKILTKMLPDSYKVISSTCKRKGKHNLYELSDVTKVFGMLKGKELNESFWPHENLKVTLLPNAHIQGACMVLTQLVDYGKSYVNNLFVGDYNNKSIFSEVKPVPQWVRNLPLNIIIEATYGNTDDDVERCFATNVAEAARKRYTIVIPTFAFERKQVVEYMLKCMQSSGKLSKSIPIFSDGTLGKEIDGLYSSGMLNVREGMTDYKPDNHHYVGKTSREVIIRSDRQKIIVTTSGMGTNGPAQMYLPAYLPKDRVLIHFTGYCAEGTYGRKLIEAKHNEYVLSNDDGGGVIALKRAKVKTTTEFSSHARKSTLLKLLKKFNNIQSIIINHGSKEAKLQLAKAVYEDKEIGCKKVAIINSEAGLRLGPYGIIKPLTTHIQE